MLEKRIEILKIESHPMRGGWIEIGSTSILLAVSKPSHPMRGGWIEIVFAMLGSIRTEPSHPMRGGWIEILMCVKHTTTRQSHPMRGGWIEIKYVIPFGNQALKSHPMRGGWIEIALILTSLLSICSPTPCGVGGLKSSNHSSAGLPWRRVPPHAGWVD